MVDSAREAAGRQRSADRTVHRRTWRPAATGATFAVEDPSTGASSPRWPTPPPPTACRPSTPRAKAQPGWAAVPPRERSDILRRAYDLLLERQEDLALLMTLEMGKPLAEARGEIAYAAEFFRWFSEEAVRDRRRLRRRAQRPGAAAS